MFTLSYVFVLLSFTCTVAMAGHPLHGHPHLRSRKHYSHSNSARNVTARAPAAKAGPLTLVDKYSGQTFFDEWDFFTAPDPTHGNVQYVSREEATGSGLATVGADGVAVISVDDTNQVPVGGQRKSVRISSQKHYNGGLFVMDANAMPTGCATWPAFWTVTAQNWPSNGEIDIVEGVNTQTRNQMTLHTGDGCTLDANARPAPGKKQAFTGKLLSTTCNALVNSNGGCGVSAAEDNTFGPIESKGGAVYAMLWDSVGIRVWNFARSEVPQDLTNGAPNPSIWPVPDAFWSTTTCNVDDFFNDHVIVINTTLCGDFAGALYQSDGCPATCAEHIADPNNFTNAKWKINYVAVYN
ncbi:glycoside hydrolase family 16 protein [Sphaerobolus stellatus SS14]|uniref:Glycoside hydrolase family 16 protein n=1 Tax=Sphaerobolus stellatus (strain SS14) TaxID=990650 RepID=A0A0C9VBU1_SPHS4|nr:glycoside hydrolase family 16 protein [Sphaerobolus stellatus SS14]